LWLRQPDEVAAEAVELREEGGFLGLKLRMGRDRPEEDITTVEAVRKSVGGDMHLMIDFNQALDMAEALKRCHMIDDLGLDWIEEPIVYDNLDGYAQLTAELKTPIQIGENFYGPRELHKALIKNACDLVMPDFMRIGCSRINASVPGSGCSCDADYRNCALARMAELGRPYS
jgi:mandelate racemase